MDNDAEEALLKLDGDMVVAAAVQDMSRSSKNVIAQTLEEAGDGIDLNKYYEAIGRGYLHEVALQEAAKIMSPVKSVYNMLGILACALVALGIVYVYFL